MTLFSSIYYWPPEHRAERLRTIRSSVFESSGDGRVQEPCGWRQLAYHEDVGVQAVLFDFGHTLFDTSSAADRCSAFGELTGSRVEPEAFERTWAEVRFRSRQPVELAKGRDLDATRHRVCWLDLLSPLNELASGLAEFVYGYECSDAGWRPYPDTLEVLEVIRSRGVAIAVVSDCGWDVRTAFARHGVAELIDAFVLSYEHGVAKPDPRLFTVALESVGVDAENAVMVGDSHLADGGAAELGITTMILPARDRTQQPALRSILGLVQPSS